MTGWKDFREIVAWLPARELKLRVDELLKHPEVKTKYRYYDQLFDAARSAPRNIAEGVGRFGNKEFARFADRKGIGAGSPQPFDRCPGSGPDYEAEFAHYEECVQRAVAVVGLIRHLENNEQ